MILVQFLGYCIGLPFASKSRFPDISILHENNIKIDMYQRHLFIRNMQSLPLKVHNVNIQKAVILVRKLLQYTVCHVYVFCYVATTF